MEATHTEQEHGIAYVPAPQGGELELDSSFEMKGFPEIDSYHAVRRICKNMRCCFLPYRFLTWDIITIQAVYLREHYAWLLRNLHRGTLQMRKALAGA